MRNSKTMTKSTIVSIALLAAVGTWGSTAAFAQGSSGSVMIMHGVHTTPEISAKCQKYAAKRVGLSGHTDTSRQAVAAACVKKLMAKQNKK
jgi:hypothetical protein